MTDYVWFSETKHSKLAIEKSLIFYYIIVSKRIKERF